MTLQQDDILVVDMYIQTLTTICIHTLMILVHFFTIENNAHAGFVFSDLPIFDLQVDLGAASESQLSFTAEKQADRKLYGE